MSVSVLSQPGAVAVPAAAAPSFSRGGSWLWITRTVRWHGADWLVHVAFTALGDVIDCASPGDGTGRVDAVQVVESCDMLGGVLRFGATPAELPELLAGVNGEVSPLPAIARLVADLAVTARAAAIHAWAVTNPVRRRVA